MLFRSPRGENIVEKNWMPVQKPSLFTAVDFDFLYDSGFTYSTETNEITEVDGPKLPVRGGSQLVGLENGTMLAITHQTITSDYMRFANIQKPPIMRRRYVHRFIQYSSNGEILKVTDMFNFLNKSIEFASGLAIKDGKLLVTFGALDSSAHIASFPLKKVLSALRPPKI